MHNDRRLGFTLSEVLITLSVVGVLALIVLPGIIKDTMSRTMISALKGTITNLNDAINAEMIAKMAMTINETNIYKDPETFLATLDANKTAANNSLFASSYKTFSGTAKDTAAMSASANLKNGVTIGILKASEPDENATLFIDTNGKKGPNVIGVDYFIATIINKSDSANGDHAGDIGCSVNEDASVATCKSTGENCYCALERASFDHKYLEYTSIY